MENERLGVCNCENMSIFTFKLIVIFDFIDIVISGLLFPKFKNLSLSFY